MGCKTWCLSQGYSEVGNEPKRKHLWYKTPFMFSQSKNQPRRPGPSETRRKHGFTVSCPIECHKVVALTLSAEGSSLCISLRLSVSRCVSLCLTAPPLLVATPSATEAFLMLTSAPSEANMKAPLAVARHPVKSPPSTSRTQPPNASDGGRVITRRQRKADVKITHEVKSTAVATRDIAS